MPGFDRTGPEGKGSRTGRGLGNCNPENTKNENIAQEETARGRMRGFFGRGRGRARGRGWNRGAGRGMGRRIRQRGN